MVIVWGHLSMPAKRPIQIADDRRAMRARRGNAPFTNERPPMPGEVLWDLGVALAAFLGVSILAQLVFFLIQAS